MNRPTSKAPVSEASVSEARESKARTSLAFAALALLGLAAPASAAPAANRFDGGWSVTATGETGDCAGPYSYAIVIRDGIVDDAGNSGVDASGRTSADGRITGTIRKGLANVAVSGRLRGSGGTGRWMLTGLGSCSGRWTARRSG